MSLSCPVEPTNPPTELTTVGSAGQQARLNRLVPVDEFTRTVSARARSQGARCNCVCPGYFGPAREQTWLIGPR